MGRGSTSPVGAGVLPKINAVEAWDGKDGEVSVLHQSRESGCVFS